MRSGLKNRTTISSAARAPPAEALEGVLGPASPCCPSNEGSSFKENININKSETPKLALEPLQMKRKKKGGGYNLRKSLAWDRAFFTEEGVLDPLELSVISGASCREGLPFINEDTPGSYQVDIKPLDLQKLENGLLKELPGEDISKYRQKDWSAAKLDSSSSSFVTSTSLTSHKVSARVGSKSGSRWGDCPRPISLSSLKRPANVNVGKAAGKESKLPKVPSKPGISTTKSSILRSKCMNHIQITQPDFNIQGNAGLKSSSKSLKNSHNASKATSLCAARNSDGNLGSSSFRRHSSANVSPVLLDKADSLGSKMISDDTTPARSVNSSKGLDEPTTFVASFSRNAHVSGRTIHPPHHQPMKPSGLRMPSPSLSFFSLPKRTVFHDSSLGDAESDVCGSRKPGNLRLQDNLKTPLKMDNKFPWSSISSCKAISSRSDCMVSSHVSPFDLTKSKLERNSVQKIHDLSKKGITEAIPHEKAKLQKIDVEVPSQSGSYKQVMNDNPLKEVIDNSLVKSESFGSGWRNPELRPEQNYAIRKSETVSAIDKSSIEKKTSSLSVLNHVTVVGTQCEDTLNYRMQNPSTMQSDWEETCKPDCLEPYREKADSLKHSPDGTAKRSHNDKIVLKTKDIASEQQGMSQQRGSCCGSASIEAFEDRRAETEDSYFGSKHPHADLSEQAAFIEVIADDLLVGEAHTRNAVCAAAIGGSKNNFNLISEVDDDTKPSGKGSNVQTICLKTESCRNVGINTSDRMLPEKHKCDENSQQENHYEELLFVVPDKQDGNELINTKSASPQSLGKKHDCFFDKDNMNRPLIGTEFDSKFDASLNERMKSVAAVVGRWHDDDAVRSNGSTNVMLKSSTCKNVSNSLHQDTHRSEFDYCSSFPESSTGDVSPKNILGKVTDTGPIIHDGSENNLLSSSLLNGSESDVDNLRNVPESGMLTVQLPESSWLNECCSEQSALLTLPNAEFVAENFAHGDDGLHAEINLQRESSADEPDEDNALGGTGDSVTGQSEKYLGSSSISAKESPLKHESSTEAYETGCQPSTVDAISDPSIVKPFTDTTKTEVSEGTDSELDQVKVETASAPNDKHRDGLNEKSRSFVLPQNAVPFSDEWLAAIEAAGEDILTRKSGAVQNSPPDKSLPEPGPWSPVKRKNNQIGPFDCTKFTNIHPSDS